ncbi:MAG: hypothetical protein AB4041_18930 [Microcystaceae cyanobacterium]
MYRIQLSREAEKVYRQVNTVLAKKLGRCLVVCQIKIDELRQAERAGEAGGDLVVRISLTDY